MIHIVIPVFNARPYLKECLDSLRAQSFRDFRIIVVDDGSKDGSSELLKAEYPEVTVVRGTGVWWWTKSINAGLEAVLSSSSPGDYLLTLNIDLHVGPDYLENLLNLAERARPCVVGSVAADRDNPDDLVFMGVEWSPWTARNKPILKPRVLKVGGAACWGTDVLPGRGTLFPLEVFAKTGVFDAEGLPQYAADDDMSLRARKAGYRLLIAPEAKVYSYVRATGMNFTVSGDRSVRAFLKSLRSIRSPFHLKTRIHFGLTHGRIGPLYVLFDLMRICGSFARLKLRS